MPRKKRPSRNGHCPTVSILYCRDSPRPQENESIRTQADLLQADCDRRGWTVELIAWDHLKSGGSLDGRPGFEEAVRAAVERKAVLYVYSLSRFARSVRDAIQTYERLDAAGATLLTLTGLEIDTTTASGRMMFHFLVTIDQYFREEGAERTSAAMLHHQSQGWRMSSRCPYGWRVDPKDPARMVVDEEEAAAVDYARELAEAGLSCQRIATCLNREGFQPRGQRWYKTTVAAVLERDANGNTRQADHNSGGSDRLRSDARLSP